jgi:D-inositol-3-phosphate glycosyltransferase
MKSLKIASDDRPRIWLYDPCNLIPNYTYRLAEALSSSAHVSLVARSYEYCRDLDWPTSVDRIWWPEGSSRILGSMGAGFRQVARVAKLVEYPFGILFLLMHLLIRPPQIFHLQWDRLPALDLIVVVLARLLGVRTVMTVHDVEPLYGANSKSFARGLLLGSVDLVLVHSVENQQRLRLIYPRLDASKVEVIKFGAVVPSAIISQSEARHRLNLDPDALICGFIGNIKEYKGLEDFLQAGIPLVSNHQNFGVLVAGRCENIDVRQKLFSLSSRHPNLRFINGYIPEAQMGDLFGACDIIVLPYRRVSQSGVVFQAFGFGRPVLATRVGGLSEAIEDRVNGLLVDSGDIAALQNMMSQIIDRRAELAQMGQNARSRLINENSWSASAAMHLRVYRGRDLMAQEMICESL